MLITYLAGSHGLMCKYYADAIDYVNVIDYETIFKELNMVMILRVVAMAESIIDQG